MPSVSPETNLSAARPSPDLSPLVSGRWRLLTIALAGSLLTWAALPPLDIWPLAWIAPVPWLLLARQERLTGRRPYAALWLAGFVFWMGALHWLRLPHWATSFGWIALSFYLAFYIPVFVGLTRVAVHRLGISIVVAAPIVFVGLELAKAHLLSGFTMGSLGHTQYRWLAFIQIADILSGCGIGGLVILGAACIARMIPWDGRRLAIWPLAPLAAMFAIVLAYGHQRLAESSAATGAPTARVALIQGSIDITMKLDPSAAQQIYNDYMRLSHSAIDQAAHDANRPLDLIVWPETMFRATLYSLAPGARPPEGVSVKQFDDQVEKVHELIAATARDLGAPLLLGIDRLNWLADGRSEHFNSGLFVAADGRQLGHYDKMHLVMFGEYVPFAEMFPFLYHLTPLPGGLTSGKEPLAEEIHGLRFAPSICYETTIPHVIRREVIEPRERGAEPDVLVNLTNDGWFWGSSELDLHLMCAVFRAVECRKPVLIAANTGFSAWIDSTGRIVQQGPRRAEGFIIADVARDPRGSFYLDFGDLPSTICLLACVSLAVVGFWNRRERREQRS
ncbi:MAG TPA: apolipoprotein N-acyltransferase [Pirellulales bacterium]|nr:apolipoprotein N-acyltransferase [Pirellulales bacterium]